MNRTITQRTALAAAVALGAVIPIIGPSNSASAAPVTGDIVQGIPSWMIPTDSGDGHFRSAGVESGGFYANADPANVMSLADGNVLTSGGGRWMGIYGTTFLGDVGTCVEDSAGHPSPNTPVSTDWPMFGNANTMTDARSLIGHEDSTTGMSFIDPSAGPAIQSGKPLSDIQGAAMWILGHGAWQDFRSGTSYPMINADPALLLSHIGPSTQPEAADAFRYADWLVNTVIAPHPRPWSVSITSSPVGLPGTTVTLTATMVDANGTPVPGAYVKLNDGASEARGYGSVSLTSSVTAAGVAANAYGATTNGTLRVGVLPAQDLALYTFTNTTSKAFSAPPATPLTTKIRFAKQIDDGNGAPLVNGGAGFVFEVRDSTSALVASLTTDGSGTTGAVDLNDGVYAVTETVVPDPAHITPAGPWTLTVSNGVATLTGANGTIAGDTVTVVNQRRYQPTVSTVRATPVIIVAGSNTGSQSDVATVTGGRPNTAGTVTIKVWDRDAQSYVTGLEASTSITTDVNGTWTGPIGPISGIPVGNYEFVETLTMADGSTATRNPATNPDVNEQFDITRLPQPQVGTTASIHSANILTAGGTIAVRDVADITCSVANGAGELTIAVYDRTAGQNLTSPAPQKMPVTCDAERHATVNTADFLMPAGAFEFFETFVDFGADGVRGGGDDQTVRRNPATTPDLDEQFTVYAPSFITTAKTPANVNIVGATATSMQLIDNVAGQGAAPGSTVCTTIRPYAIFGVANQDNPVTDPKTVCWTADADGAFGGDVDFGMQPIPAGTTAVMFSEGIALDAEGTPGDTLNFGRPGESFSTFNPTWATQAQPVPVARPGVTVSLIDQVIGSGAQPGTEVCVRLTASFSAMIVDPMAAPVDTCFVAAADGSFGGVVPVTTYTVQRGDSFAGSFAEQALIRQSDGTLVPVGAVYVGRANETFAVGTLPTTA